MYLTKRHRHRPSKTHHHIRDALQTTIPASYQDAVVGRTQTRHRATDSEDFARPVAEDSKRASKVEEMEVRKPRPVRPQDIEKEKWRQKLRDE